MTLQPLGLEDLSLCALEAFDGHTRGVFRATDGWTVVCPSVPSPLVFLSSPFCPCSVRSILGWAYPGHYLIRMKFQAPHGGDSQTPQEQPFSFTELGGMMSEEAPPHTHLREEKKSLFQSTPALIRWDTRHKMS